MFWLTGNLFKVCVATGSRVVLLPLPGLRSRRFLGGVGVGFLRTLGVGVGFFYQTSTPYVQLNHFYVA